MKAQLIENEVDLYSEIEILKKENYNLKKAARTNEKKISELNFEKENIQKKLLFREAVAKSSKGINMFVLDKDYRYLEFSIEHKQMMAATFSAEIEVDMKFLDYLNDEDNRKQVKKNFDKVLSGENLVSIETYKKNGKEKKWYECKYCPLYDIKNNVIGLNVYIYDISKQKLIEQVLRKNQLIYQTIADYNYDLEYWLGSDGKFIYLSPSCKRVTGYLPEEFMQNPELYLKIINKNDVHIFKNHSHKIDAGGHLLPIEFRIINKKGHERWIEHLCQAVYDNEGNYIGQRGSNRDITDRKNIQQNLLNSEKKLEKIFQTIPDAISLNRLDGTYLSVNNSFIEISGFSRKEVIGKSTSELNIWYEEKDQMLYKEILVKNKQIQNFETKFKHKNGNIVVALVSAVLIEHKGEHVILTIVRDITERNQIQKELKNSEKRYSMLSSLTNEGIIIHNQGIVLDANKAFERLSGYTLKEVTGENIINLIIPQKYHQLLFNNIAKKTTMTYEVECIKKGGKIIPIEIQSKNIICRKTGKEVRVSVIRDKSKLKENELEIQKLSKAVEQSPVSVVITNTDGIIEYVNPKFTELSGYSYEEAIGNSPKILKSGVHTNEFYAELWNTVKNGNVWRGELLNKKKDGELHWESTSIAPIKNTKGEITHFVAVKDDITEMKNMVEELIKAKNKAERADKMKSNFLAQMSHEIRTPINAMISLSSLIRDDIEDQVSDDLKFTFELIQKAGVRIVRTVELLLNLSEIQAGTYEVIKKNINLYADILGKVIVEYKKLAAEKNLEIDVVLKTENMNIVADFYTVEQIFTQLLDNAVKYTKQGKITVTTNRDKGSNLFVEVTDTGIGIDKEYLSELFTPFSQEQEGYTRKFEGNGIGLALVKKYCEMNNAEIEVISEKGKGSTFRVIF